MQTKLAIFIDLATDDGRDIPPTANPDILMDFRESVNDADTIILRAIRGAFNARRPGLDPRFTLARVGVFQGGYEVGLTDSVEVE